MSIFIEGLRDSFNPFSLLGTLLFALFLGRYVYTILEVIFFGAFFIMVSYYIQYIVLMGSFDPFFKLREVELGFQFFSLAIAVFFLFKGGRHFILWKYSNKEFLKKGNLSVSRVLSDQKKYKNTFFHFLRVSGYFIFLGEVTVFLKALWPQEYYLLLNYYFLVSDGQVMLGFKMILKYLIGSNLLNVSVWFFCIWVVRSENFKFFLRKQYSFRNMLNSAIFISGGIGLIYGNLVKFNII